MQYTASVDADLETLTADYPRSFSLGDAVFEVEHNLPWRLVTLH